MGAEDARPSRQVAGALSVGESLRLDVDVALVLGPPRVRAAVEGDGRHARVLPVRVDGHGAELVVWEWDVLSVQA